MEMKLPVSDPDTPSKWRVWRIVAAILAVAVICVVAMNSKFWDGAHTVVEERVAAADSEVDVKVSADVFGGEGALVKCAGKPAVFQIYGGKKRWIPNPATFNKLYTGWNKIKTISCRSLARIPTGPAYTSGASLIKCGRFPHIYLKNNGQKLWICNPASYNQFSFAWNKVQKLKMVDCRKICNGPILCNSLGHAVRAPYYNQLIIMGPTCRRRPMRGELFKCRGSPIYQFLDGRSRWIPNPRTFNGLYGRVGWQKVLTYPKPFCKVMPKGFPLSKGARLIRCGRYPHIFLLSNGKKRWICDPKTYNFFNFQWSSVKRFSVGVCRKICTGPTICLSRRSAVRRPFLGQLRRLGRACRVRRPRPSKRPHKKSKSSSS